MIRSTRLQISLKQQLKKKKKHESESIQSFEKSIPLLDEGDEPVITINSFSIYIK